MRGCRSSDPATARDSDGDALTPTPVPTATPVPKTHGTVFVIILENRERANALPTAMPYLQRLASTNVQATQFFAVTHPSLPSRLAILTGSTQGVTDDTIGHWNVLSIFEGIEGVGKTWGYYTEGQSGTCSLSGSANYPGYHNIPMQLTLIANNPTRCANDKPLTSFAGDLADDAKSLMWIEPDQLHSGHDTDAATADAWLQAFVPKILASATYQDGGRLIITFDEGETGAGCCNGQAMGGNVAFVVVSPNGPQGLEDSRTLDQYALTRTLGDFLGFPPPGAGASAPTMTNLFARGGRP